MCQSIHCVDQLLARRVVAVLCVCVLATGWLVSVDECSAQAKGSILIDFLEKDVDSPLTCRIRILDEAGRDARPRGVVYEKGWSLVEGSMQFKGRAGNYTYQVFHGPQFSAGSGGFTIDRNAEGHDTVFLPRHANLDEEGWYAGDLLASGAADKTIRWLPAEDLTMACLVSDQPLAGNDLQRLQLNDRWVDRSSFLDSRLGSGLVLHHWMPPASVPDTLPSSRLLVMAKQHPPTDGETVVHAEIQQLWARDVPIWLASQRIDSIQLLGSHLTHDGSQGDRVAPLEIPEGYFNGQRGAGRLVEQIYWKTLEAGLRIAPSAGSAFTSSASPLGYNRVYAACDSISPNQWWAALRQGRCFVTNGPLLRVAINQQLPGHVFEIAKAESLKLDIDIKLTVADPVEYLDVIFNGQSLYQARLDEYARQGGKIPSLAVSQSGWLLVRVVTERDFTYRMACTAPYYVEMDGQPRISRSAVAFFQNWLNKSVQAMQPASRSAAQPYVDAAVKFWSEQSQASNAD